MDGQSDIRRVVGYNAKTFYFKTRKERINHHNKSNNKPYNFASPQVIPENTLIAMTYTKR
jgi:hypothetical protein